MNTSETFNSELTRPIIWNRIGDHINQYFGQSSGLLYLVAPFIAKSALARLTDGCSINRCLVVTSWRADYLVSGHSSLDLYEFCRARDWTLLINDRLHAKFYSRCLESGWIGSANITMRGLDYSGLANNELLYFCDPLPSYLRIWSNKLVSESTVVDDEVYRTYSDWLAQQEPAVVQNVTGPQLTNTLGRYFYIDQLPASSSPDLLWEALKASNSAHYEGNDSKIEHDMALYGIAFARSKQEFSEILGRTFLAHPFIQALHDKLDEGPMRFGAIKEWIQNTCNDIPTPYRKDLTEITQNLLRWLLYFANDRYRLERPNYTEVLSKI